MLGQFSNFSRHVAEKSLREGVDPWSGTPRSMGDGVDTTMYLTDGASACRSNDEVSENMKPHTERGTDGNERAVSPVIGVILMVAITVILAAVIGVFVLGLGDAVQQTAPNTNLDHSWDGDENEQLTIVHNGGDSLSSDEVYLVGPDDRIGFDDGVWGLAQGESWPDSISAGTSRTAVVNDSSVDIGPDVSTGETYRIVWESGGSSSTLKTIERPE